MVVYLSAHSNRQKNKQNKQNVKLTQEDKALQLFQDRAASKFSDDLYRVKGEKDSSVEYEVI